MDGSCVVKRGVGLEVGEDVGGTGPAVPAVAVADPVAGSVRVPVGPAGVCVGEPMVAEGEGVGDGGRVGVVVPARVGDPAAVGVRGVRDAAASCVARVRGSTYTLPNGR